MCAYLNFRMLKFAIIFVLLNLAKPGQFQHEDVYDDEFLQSSDQMLRKFWGIQDVTTSVGKLFYYKVPNDAFKGTILYYDVVGDENSTLPKWMIYDKKTAVLEGVPSVNDVGDTRINVKAYDNKGQSVSDMFVVEVYPLWETNTNNKRKCKKGEGVMMITLIINENFDNITPRQKILALRNLAKYLHLPVNTLLFLNSKENLGSNSETSVFGNEVNEKEEQNTSVITWQIGCKEKIWAEKLQIVEIVENYMKDGTLAERLQLPVLRWQIASSFNPFRTRRHTEQNNNRLKDDDKDDAGLDDDADEDDEVDDEPELDEDDSQSENILPSSASPVYPEVTNTQLYQPGLKTSNPRSNKIPIIDSVISNQTLSKLKISPNSTSFLLSSEQTDNDEDTTEAIENLDDLINWTKQNYSSGVDERGVQDNLDSPISNGSTTNVISNEKSTTQSPKRYPPQVKRNFEQILVEAGKPLKVSIPEDIFIDSEDGNTRNLTLKLYKPEECVVYAPWIDLTENQELHIFTSLDTISKHELTLEAKDSDNMSVNTSIIVNVQHPQNARTINFEISLHFKLHENQNLTVPMLFDVLNIVAGFYSDADYGKITIRNVTCNPFVLTWANTTLPRDHCDNKTIMNLINVLNKEASSMDVQKHVYLAFERNGIIVEKLTWRGITLCNEIPLPRIPMTERNNFLPILRNRIDNITATVGELMVLRVPEDTFFDADEPNGRNLKLNVYTVDNQPISADNWLQFDTTNQEFYGLPMSNNVGSVKYQLVCNDNKEDTEIMKVRHVIEVVVEPGAKNNFNVEFRMKLKKSYDEFAKSQLLKRTFVEKLAKLFDDKNTSSVVISGYSPDSLSSNSLIITWHNKSLPFNACDEPEITNLRKVLLTDEMKLENNVNEVLKPDFEAVSIDISPTGICEGSLTEHHIEPPEVNTGSQEIHAIIFDNIYFINSVLPIAIIIVMILVASLIACVLYRSQRSTAKWTLGDDEKRTYRNKGIPVIFQDELEERLEPTNKSPIILKGEKPPLPPPDYQKVPPVATTALLSDFDDSSRQQGSGTYSRSMERNGRSKPTPNYRKPPPYVPQ
ncbi:dystroglycan 1-like [Planococcus citri]|uniref:dystroglycan 1-like n=1 Tax=Planococcus citri TaxID=170843 RepID=UPI0031F7B1B5